VSTAAMLPVLKLFLIPVGGGIPAGVLLARAKGVAWPVTALLYLFSDVVLAVAFEPVLRIVTTVLGKIPFCVNFAARMKVARARSAAKYGGTGAGPVSLVMISFGVDPMTGRTAALAAGHGFIAGWAFAVAGDMLYFALIAVTTLELNSYFKDPGTTEMLVLAAMFIVPALIRRIRPRTASGSCA
jgi:hypothetical protein